MTNKNIKLIALDMDGTLLTTDHQVTDRTKKAIQQALEKDIHVLLSTGRGFQNCYPVAEELKLKSYLITANGGQVWTINKELLDEHLLETALIEKLYNLGTQVGVNMWMISTEGVFRDEAPEDFHQYDWLKFGCETTDENKLAIMMEELSKYEELELTNSLPTNVEANPAGVSKANALEFVCERIGITMENVMAVGDSLNDIKMIQQAGLGVAMDNAQEAIKNVADATTASNNDDGVAKAIEEHILHA